MNHYVKIALVLCVCVALTSAQFRHFGAFSDFAPSFDSNYNYLSSAVTRDPRGNTGPVLFPQSPASDPSQTSGVRVGASGYGFVPPSNTGPALPRYVYRRFYFR